MFRACILTFYALLIGASFSSSAMNEAPLLSKSADLWKDFVQTLKPVDVDKRSHIRNLRGSPAPETEAECSALAVGLLNINGMNREPTSVVDVGYDRFGKDGVVLYLRREDRTGETSRFVCQIDARSALLRATLIWPKAPAGGRDDISGAVFGRVH